MAGWLPNQLDCRRAERVARPVFAKLRFKGDRANGEIDKNLWVFVVLELALGAKPIAM